MTEPTHWRVTWTTFVDAETPNGAAAHALATQRNTSSTAVVFDVEPEDGRGPSAAVDLLTTATVCRHAIPGVIYPARANGDDTHDWVERCDTCEVYETDEQATAAVLAYYAERDIGLVIGHAEPFGLDFACPYVDASYAVQLPALELHDAIARLQRAGWVEVAADLLDGEPPHVVLARLADDPECREAAFVLNRVRGGYELLTKAQNTAADYGYGCLAYVHDAANSPRNTCLGAYHGPAGEPAASA